MAYWRIAVTLTAVVVLVSVILSPFLVGDAGTSYLVAACYLTAMGAILATSASIRRLHDKAREAEYAQRIVEDLYHHAPCGYHSLNAAGQIARINQTELEMLGFEAREVLGKSYTTFVAPEHRARFDEAFARVLRASGDDVVEIECDLISKEGARIPVALRSVPKTDANDDFIRSRGMVFDLTERKRLEAKLARLARTDALTGMGNRRHFDEMGLREIQRRQRYGTCLSLVVADIDFFKRINDAHGHDIGDEALKHFSALVQATLRSTDIVCRLGGEEFALLLTETDIRQATHVAERLREIVEASPMTIGEGSASMVVRFTVSLGVTEVLPEEDGLKAAIKRADIALYAAKRRGRNRVEIDQYEERV